MIAGLAVLVALLVHRWLPPTAHPRIAAITGRPLANPPLVRWQQWRGQRAARAPGQPATTRLLQSLVAELSAGMTTAAAFEHVMGRDCADPDALATNPPTADARVWRDVAAVWRASDAVGFSMAGALQRILGHALIEQEVVREVRANIAAPRFALLTLAALPAMAWTTGSVVGGDALAFLLRNPLGWLCLLVGVGLYALAWAWMRVLVREALR